jgi:hypothetical protein
MVGSRMSFSPGDLIVYLRETWEGDLDPDEHNYTGFILDEVVMLHGDPRLPPDILRTGRDESLGIHCFHIMWCDGGTRGARAPDFNWNRADYIEKWYELA